MNTFKFLIASYFLLKAMATFSETAIIGATIIDGNGGDPITNGVVVIENGLIINVGDHTTPYSQDAIVVPAKDKFLSLIHI